MLFATIFLVCFVILGGLVMYLARTIEHGEARFDASGQEIKNELKDEAPARPAQRLDRTDTPRQVNNNE